MSLPREWSFQATDDDALQVDMSAVRTASSRSDGVDDNQNSLGGSLFSIHSAPVLELNTNSCRPSGLLLEGNARSVDTGLPCHTSPHDTIVDEDDNDNLLTISSLTARPLIAKSRELRSSKLKKKRKQCTDYRPDGGYGWAVVFGAFLVQFWVAGLVKSYGVLFVEVMEAYSDSSASVASWIPAILSALCLALAPLTSALCQRFSCRTVVFVGGFFCALGLTISYFATRLIHLFFTFGVLTGIGGGLSTTPGIVMVAQYFDKHRALANGICVSGTAAGSFVFPVLIEHLCATFGFHGTLLVLGGCMLHVCISASLYRPIKPPSTSDDQKTNRKSASPQSALHQMQKTRTDAPLQLLFQTGVPLATVTSPHKLVLPAELFSQNAILIDPLNISDSDEEKDQIGETIFMKRISAFRSSSILHSVEDLSTDSTCVYKSRQREPLSRSMIVVSTADQVLTAARVQKENIITKDQLSDVPIEMKKRTLSQKISRYLDLSLLKDVSFIMMCLSVTLMSAGSPYMLYYLPAYCLSSGYTKTEAGYLVAISAALDLCGRLGLGWLSDLHLFDRRKGYIGSIVGAGVAVLVIPVADSFYVLACSVGMYGLCLGCWFLLVPVLLADKYGTDKISSSYGLVRMFQSFGAISVPPLAGYMRDVTGGYDICFYCMGTCMVLGGVPLLLVPDNFYSSDNGDEENNKTSSSSVVSAPRK